MSWQGRYLLGLSLGLAVKKVNFFGSLVEQLNYAKAHQRRFSEI
jgi:hypothetical protein